MFVHGFGASVPHWGKVFTHLVQSGDRYDWYGLDLLGFGASTKANTTYGTDLWSAQLYDFWRTFINEPVVLVGNSLGSLVSLVASDRYPAMVQSLVMINLPDPAMRQAKVPRSLRPGMAQLERLLAAKPILDRLLTFVRQPAIIQKWVTLAYAQLGVVDGELVEILCAPPHDQAAPTAFYRLCQSSTYEEFAPDVNLLLARSSLPMLLLWGDRDRFVPVKLGRILAQTHPHLHYRELTDLGHCLHDEQPELFLQILEQWLGNPYPHNC